MLPKTYAIEIVDEIASKIAAAPPLPKKLLTQEQALKKLTKQIRALQAQKNYSPQQIIALLKENGIKVTAKEIKNVLEKRGPKIAATRDVKKSNE